MTIHECMAELEAARDARHAAAVELLRPRISERARWRLEDQVLLADCAIERLQMKVEVLARTARRTLARDLEGSLDLTAIDADRIPPEHLAGIRWLVGQAKGKDRAT